MYINRTISDSIQKELNKARPKIMVIYGARQVGKTTLVEHLLKDSPHKILRLNGDRLTTHTEISSTDLQKLTTLTSGYDIIFIDEAQRIPQIGLNLKILYDHFPHLKIIVTGSSSLDLASSVKEPLTGRKKQYILYPVSFLELSQSYTPYELTEQLTERLIFGSYPNLLNITGKQEKIEYISELSEDYLYKDVLELENIRYHQKIRDLLKLLAFQIGNEVSYHELATSLSISKETVARYIDLLEQSFVIFTLKAFSKNLRKEVNKKPKIYFYDLGIRNAIIHNFAYLNDRNDTGQLWENFLILERMKRNNYQSHLCAHYFWRTYTGAELDYVEEYDGMLHGYEFKWNKSAIVPKAWQETYNGQFSAINKDNFLKFIL